MPAKECKRNVNNEYKHDGLTNINGYVSISYCAMAHDQFPNYPPTYGIPPRSPRWATLCLKARVFVSRVYTKMYENDRISHCDVS